MRIGNRIVAAHSRRGSAGRFSLDSLLENAARRTKLTDFGVPSFEGPLERLITALNGAEGLHPIGVSLARALLTRLLGNRLYVEEAWRNDPEIARGVIRQPIVILGLPRTGTTFLFNLLAQDPDHRFLTNWEGSRPAAPPGRWHGSPTVRRAASFLQLRLQHTLAPSLRTHHEAKVDGPEECTALLMAEFACVAFGALFDVPEYLDWICDCDLAPTLHYHRRQLMVVNRRRTATRWLLKSPHHLPGLEALLATYPDACIVQLHRDPADVIGSCCALIAALRGIFTDRLDPAAIREQTVATLERNLRRAVVARARAPARQICDLHYEDLVTDPAGAVRELYAHFGLALKEVAESRMRRAVARSAGRKSAGRPRRVECFAIDRAAVRSRFEWYTSRFNVPVGR